MNRLWELGGSRYGSPVEAGMAFMGKKTRFDVDNVSRLTKTRKAEVLQPFYDD